MSFVCTLLPAVLLAVLVAGSASAAPGAFAPRAHAVAQAHKAHTTPVYAPAARGVSAGSALPAGAAAGATGSQGLHPAALSYVAGLRSEVLADVMRGHGPYLAALARRLGCPGSVVPLLARRARNALAPVHDSATPRRVAEALRAAIRADPALGKLCR